MSKVLVLKDGTQLEFTDESTILNLVTVLSSFADADPIAAKITNDNLSTATFDGEAVTNVVFVSIRADKDVYGNILLTVANRYKTDIEILQETQAQQDEVINYLLMG